MSTQPNTTDLDRLEALAKAATPGPWDVEDGEVGHDVAPFVFVHKPGDDGAPGDGMRIKVEQHHMHPARKPVTGGPAWNRLADGALNNAAFVAAANPAAILELIALARRSQPVAATQQAAREQQEPVACLSSADFMRIVRANWGDMAAIEAAFNANLAAPVAQQSEAGAWTWEKRAEAAEAFMRNYADANMGKLLEGYEVQPIIRRLAAAILEWQLAVQAVEAGAPTAAAKNCGTFACRAAQKDGIVCADGECDIESGMRTAPTSGRESAAPGAQQDAKADTCIYPKCNCPFDAPSDPSWCARGLQKGAQHG